MNLLIMILGFIILSPGVFLTIPPLSQSQAVKKGLSYLDTGLASSCIDMGQWNLECLKYKKVFFSGQTSQFSVYFHTIIFFLYLTLFKISFNERLYFSILFLILSPGMFLSLPGMTKEDCARAGVAEGRLFCDAVIQPLAACRNCQSILMSDFTSWQQVIVHATLFGFACYAIIKIEHKTMFNIDFY
jgi:hypothetical protein